MNLYSVYVQWFVCCVFVPVSSQPFITGAAKYAIPRSCNFQKFPAQVSRWFIYYKIVMFVYETK